MSYDSKKSSPMVQRMKAKQAKEVPLDYFLYACYETEKLQDALQDDSPKIPQWPEIQGIDKENLPDDIEHSKLEELVEDLLGWYCANFPDLSSNEIWSFYNINSVTPPLVAMGRDVELLFEIKSDSKIPVYDTDQDTLDAFWVRVEGLLAQFFNSKQELMSRYFEWCFGKEPKVEPNLGQRPPVGRFAPNFRGRKPGGPHQGSGGGGGFHKKNDHGGKGKRGDNRGRRDGKNRHSGGGGKKFNNRDRRGKTDPELEAVTLGECDSAFSKLEQDPGLEKVVLKPQNSFYRRLQY